NHLPHSLLLLSQIHPSNQSITNPHTLLLLAPDIVQKTATTNKTYNPLKFITVPGPLKFLTSA
ncbi:unnamed protein product, partial [Ceratitis capitata]